MNKRQLKEMKNCFDKLVSPPSDISTQSITPVKRTSRFDRVRGASSNGEVSSSDSNDHDYSDILMNSKSPINAMKNSKSSTEILVVIHKLISLRFCIFGNFKLSKFWRF